jgi:NADH-quinone oxidoreductase subunit E
VTFAPEVDQRLRAEAADVIARYPQARSALLPLLHLVQSEEGYVSPRGIEFCADVLDLTTAEVSGVATFYTQYKRHPNGDYTVGVCTNTLCAIMGGDQIFGELADYLGVDHDETTEDGKITLERVECNAACDFAPVLMVNWEFLDNQTPATARQLVDDIKVGKGITPTRGANTVCTFKQMSRVLAGFTDGRGDEGVGANGATLEGLKLARRRGWSVPGLYDDDSRRTNGSGSGSGSGGGVPVEQIAEEQVADPGAPSAHDAASAGQADRAPRKRATKRKDGQS